MNTNRLARSHSHSAVQSDATPNTDLISAFCQMTAGIKKPKRIAWKMYDAARGRPINPLGTFPEVAEECIEAGASFYNVAKPLTVMLAHLRRRLNNTRHSVTLAAVIVESKRACDEAEASGLTVALSVERPEVSDLLTLEARAEKAIEELELVKEKAEDEALELREVSHA